MVYILSGSCCAMYRSLQVFLKAKTVHENSNCAIPCKLALVRLLSARYWLVLLQPSSSQCPPTCYNRSPAIGGQSAGKQCHVSQLETCNETTALHHEFTNHKRINQSDIFISVLVFRKQALNFNLSSFLCSSNMAARQGHFISVLNYINEIYIFVQVLNKAGDYHAGRYRGTAFLPIGTDSSMAIPDFTSFSISQMSFNLY